MDNNNNKIPKKIGNKDKKCFFRKIKELGKRAKLFLKAHFPKRVWPTPQEKRKGQKF